MSFFPGRPWQTSMWLLTGLLVAGAILGRVLLGSGWIGIALIALALVVWHYVRLWRVLRLLRERRRLVAPSGSGVWGELESLLYRRQRESLVRKRKLALLTRALCRVAAAVPARGVVLHGPGAGY